LACPIRVFTVDTKKFRLPKNVTGNTVVDEPEKEKKDKDNNKGKICIVMSNYQVNKGIPDDVFKK
jgi:hypothetical protein